MDQALQYIFDFDQNLSRIFKFAESADKAFDVDTVKIAPRFSSPNHQAIFREHSAYPLILIAK